ncbi:MAG: hypothetical protein FWG29_00930 [Treponema sp.]|nr:hypothetical protein [Treponema sp.]
MSEYSISALKILRNPQATMKWYIVPLFVLLVYIITREFKSKSVNVLLGAAALWGMDLFNELINSIVFHATGFAPIWGTPDIGGTALLILIGYNIEISIMFFIMGLQACHSLPDDKHKKYFGINNRVLFALVLTALSVAVECFLNYAGVLTWEYSWWSIRCPWLIYLFGYLPFFTMAFIVHDMEKRKNQLMTLGIIYGVDITLLVVFGSIGWM